MALYYQRKYLTQKFSMRKGLSVRRIRKREDFKPMGSDLDAEEILLEADQIIKWHKKG